MPIGTTSAPCDLRAEDRLARRTRRERCAAEFTALDDELQAWVSRRHARDEYSQYETQLDAVGSLVGGAASELARTVTAWKLTQPLPELYRECKTYEVRALWLRRMWDFFRDKFDQRDRDGYELPLRAADEVVWSCFHAPLERLGARTRSSPDVPAPLPFIESRYAFEAFPPTLIPPDLRMDKGFMRAYLERLPVGVVRLPPSAVREPWWLVLIAHEAGHQIQYHLLPGGTLVDEWKTAIGGGAEAAGADEQDASDWRAWAGEIFADAFSVLVAGHWALVALIELELANDDMSTPRAQYPSPLVRLSLLAQLADTVGLRGSETLESRAPELGRLPDALAGIVANVVVAALSPLPGIGVCLQDLCGVEPDEFARGGQVDSWADQLLARPEPAQPDPDDVPKGSGVRAARLMSCAALAAWTRVCEIEDDNDRQTALTLLADRGFRAIAASRDTTTRAASAEAIDKDLGRKLGAALAAVAPEDLEPEVD